MAKSFKRTLIATLGVLFLVVTALAFAACSTKSFKVTLDFESTQGSVVLDPEADGNTYAADTEVKVTVTPNTGYEVDTFLVNGTAATLDANSSYTFKVEKDTTVAVTFKVTTYTITLSNDTNKGTVTLDKSGPLASGTEVKGTIAPKAAYDVDSVKVNDTPVTVANDLTFTFTVNGPTAVNVVYKDADPGLLPTFEADMLGTYLSADKSHIITIAADAVRFDGNVVTVKKYKGAYSVVIADVEYEFAGIDGGILTLAAAEGEEYIPYFKTLAEPAKFDAHLNGTWTEDSDEPVYTVVIADGAAKINDKAVEILAVSADDAEHFYVYYLVDGEGSIYVFSDDFGSCTLQHGEDEVYLTGNHPEINIELDEHFVGKWRGIDSGYGYAYILVLDYKSQEDIKLTVIDVDTETDTVYTLTISEADGTTAFYADDNTDGSWRLSIDPDAMRISISQSGGNYISCNMSIVPVNADGTKLTAFPAELVFEGKWFDETLTDSLVFTSDALTVTIGGTATTIGVADVTPEFDDSFALLALSFTINGTEYYVKNWYESLSLTIGDDEAVDFSPVYDIPKTWYGTYTDESGDYSITISADGVTDVILGGTPFTVALFMYDNDDESVTIQNAGGDHYTITKSEDDSDGNVTEVYIELDDDPWYVYMSDSSKVPPYSVDIDVIPDEFISTWYAFDKDDSASYVTGDIWKIVISANKLVITVNDGAPTTISVADIKFHAAGGTNYSDTLIFTYDDDEIELRFSSYTLYWYVSDSYSSTYDFTEDPVTVYGDPADLLEGVSGNWKDDTYRVDIADGVVTLYVNDGESGNTVYGLLSGSTDTIVIGSSYVILEAYYIKIDTANNKLVLTVLSDNTTRELAAFTISHTLPGDYAGTWNLVGDSRGAKLVVSSDGNTATYYNSADGAEGTEVTFSGIEGVYTFVDSGSFDGGVASFENNNTVLAVTDSKTKYYVKENVAAKTVPTALAGSFWSNGTSLFDFSNNDYVVIGTGSAFIYGADEATHTYTAYTQTAKYVIVSDGNTMTVNGTACTKMPEKTIGSSGLCSWLYGTWTGTQSYYDWDLSDYVSHSYTLVISADSVTLTVDGGQPTTLTPDAAAGGMSADFIGAALDSIAYQVSSGTINATGEHGSFTMTKTA